MVELYRRGNTISGVTELLERKFGRTTVARVLYKSGVVRPLCEIINLSEDTKREALRLYSEKELNRYEVADALGIGYTTVGRWVIAAGVSRGRCESQSLRAALGRNNAHGLKCGFIRCKNDKVWTDSAYEFARIYQLNKDPKVRSVRRCPHRIPCGKSFYNPDLLIEMENGDKFVEEIKPSPFLIRPRIILKRAAAIEFYAQTDIKYRMITEIDIGVSGFDNEIVDELEISEKDKQRVRYSFGCVRGSLSKLVDR